MSQLIFRGVKNPANCSECFFWSICPCLADFDDYSAILDAVHDGNLVRHEECPVSPLPQDHGRLGDLTEIEKKLQKTLDGMGDRWLSSPTLMAQRVAIVADLKKVKEAPTIIPAEGGGAQ